MSNETPVPQAQPPTQPKKYKPLQQLSIAYDPGAPGSSGTIVGVDKDGRVWIRADCTNPNSRWLEIAQPFDEV